MDFSEELDKPIGWRNGRMVTPRQLNEKAAANHHNVYVVELLREALKRKKLLRDNPNADHSKEPLYIGSTGHPVEQRFSNHKSNIKGNVFVQKYGLKLRPDLYQRYNPMSFADAEVKEIALAKELRANGHAVVGGNEKVAMAEGKPDLVARWLSRIGYLNPQHVVTSALIGQEKFHRQYGVTNKANDKDITAAISKMEAQHGDRLKNVVHRLGGTNLKEDFQNVWRNPNNNIAHKLLGSLQVPLSYPLVNLGRMDHYNPLTNTATVFSKLPAVHMHELGHGVDFNKSTPTKSSLYTSAHVASNAAASRIPGAQHLNPFTQWAETQANRNVFKALKSEPEKAETRRRLWPARGTYVGAAAGGLASLLNPETREGLETGDKGAILDSLRNTLIGTVGGAVAGRGTAELRNLYEKHRQR
jgi:hypothetical protein